MVTVLVPKYGEVDSRKSKINQWPLYPLLKYVFNSFINI